MNSPKKYQNKMTIKEEIQVDNKFNLKLTISGIIVALTTYLFSIDFFKKSQLFGNLSDLISLIFGIAIVTLIFAIISGALYISEFKILKNNKTLLALFNSAFDDSIFLIGTLLIIYIIINTFKMNFIAGFLILLVMIILVYLTYKFRINNGR